jgi:Flp pilus assembly protein TadG
MPNEVTSNNEGTRKRFFRSRRGSSIVEFSFLIPFYALLFIGAYVMGVDCYALVSLQSAARTSAVYCSLNTCTTGTTDTTVCNFALDALRGLPNVGSSVTACSSPVTISVASATGPDSASSVVVTVSYTLPAMAQVPGLPWLSTASRSAQMRVSS